MKGDERGISGFLASGYDKVVEVALLNIGKGEKL
jgi:hypothetical protein